MTELTRFLKENEVKFVDFRFTDLIGKTNSITYNTDKLIVEEIQLIPDKQTIFLDPFCVQSTAVILCDKGSRSLAKRAQDYMLSTKNEVLFGFEMNFSIFDEIKFVVKSNHSYIRLSPVEHFLNTHKNIHEDIDSTLAVDPLFDLRSEILLMMRESNIKGSLSHKKISTSQGSILVENSRLLSIVDSIQKSKHIIRNVAHSYGKTATFMPNPLAQSETNSLHIYQSLQKTNENLRDDENELYYMNGIMKHIKAINAFSNPTTNSYKKTIPSPTQFTALFFPDSAMNSYLCFAVILMAGLDGIKNKVTSNEVKMPTSLNEALNALNEDRDFLLQGKVFTNEQIDQYIKIKRDEIKQIESAINPMEFYYYSNS
ncbi:MAG: glutamine synthetase family protein [Wolbachia endosymbiont of Fragariocoptes setiger]|nr:glutamine synthetase family protein [Wolbachia endosymbiont of Fragariocoptes setiger]